jgi:hypothetical protein
LLLARIIVPGVITGTVRDAEDGSPLVGATVSSGTRMATTDASGAYVIADLSAGTYQVTASKSGYHSSMSTVMVVSGGTAIADFSLTEKPPASNPMWVDTIRFSRRGRNLFVEVGVVTVGGVLRGADVGIAFACSSGDVLDFSGTTDSDGLVRFRAHKPPIGDYVITVASLTCTGFVWDMSEGVTGISYALGR